MFMSETLKRKHENFNCGVEHERALRVKVVWRGVRGSSDQGHSHHHHDHSDEHSTQNLNLFSPQPAFKPPTDTILYNENGPVIRFEINLIIDIDTPFIKKQGSPQKSIEYVNWLITSANIIFEKEIGVRLNVVHIQEVKIFEPATDLRGGLLIMREKYDNTNPDGVTLHHALLGKYIGGGIAFIDRVCDEKYGVRLSSGLEGRVATLRGGPQTHLREDMWASGPLLRTNCFSKNRLLSTWQHFSTTTGDLNMNR
jgi:hypothetical protein